jgi:pimeloyl-ACP methyl ester carboxylesterase
MVVDDRLGLPGRGVAAQDAGAQARGHGHQADGFQVRVETGGHVETATATTRVHAYRPHPGGEPVVLLTGAGGNAAHWYPHVAAMAEAGPVYGIDMPGDANPSVPRAPLTRRSPAPPGWMSCSASSAPVRRTWSASLTEAGSP